MKVTAKLGKSVFQIDDTGSNVSTITRWNSDGVTEFFVPRQLLVNFAIELAKEALVPLLQKVLSGVKL